MRTLHLARSTDEEKEMCLARLEAFHAQNADKAPAALKRLQEVALSRGNVFAELMNTVEVIGASQR